MGAAFIYRKYIVEGFSGAMLASTHALFRAFDGYDRQKFCYVQGTGASSIVRTLERWVVAD